MGYWAQGREGLAIIFTLLNSTQGVWILVFHILLNKKAVKEVDHHWRHLMARLKSVVLRQPLDETTTPPASRAVISSSGDQTAKKSTASSSNDVTATTTSGGGESLNNSHNGGNRPSRNPSSNNITV